MTKNNLLRKKTLEAGVRYLIEEKNKQMKTIQLPYKRFKCKNILLMELGRIDCQNLYLMQEEKYMK